MTEFRITVHSTLEEIPADLWDACANPRDQNGENASPYDPFVAHAFLLALEESGSACADTGWAAQHLCVSTQDDTILGVMPVYLKNHSYGEYVFDWAWADAFNRAGGHYYPKLQACVPFTPATGRRLLARPRDQQSDVEQVLLQGAAELTQQMETSSFHITFLSKHEWDLAGQVGLLQRTHQQFHWLNKGYTCFDDFLSDLASRKRKNLRKEREAALQNDIEIEWLTGSDLREHHWDAFYNFYTDTGLRKWGRPYLNREFFSRINDTMADDILLVMCRRQGRYIAGALNFIGGDTLFGRNWGCLEDHRFLHFEACYYQAIEFAIDRGLQKVEAGAQGAHKLARGYMPVHTYSAHYIPDPRFRAAVENYLDHERLQTDEDIGYLESHTPFRHSQE